MKPLRGRWRKVYCENSQTHGGLISVVLFVDARRGESAALPADSKFKDKRTRFEAKMKNFEKSNIEA